MSPRRIIGVLISALALAATGCGNRPAAAGVEQLFVYSLIPGDQPPAEALKIEEVFHDFRSLGKVEIMEPNERTALLDVLAKSVDKGQQKKCFNPRHGIRFIRNGEAIDFVISFECQNVSIHAPQSERFTSIDDRVLELLNRHLKNARIPLDGDGN